MYQGETETTKYSSGKVWLWELAMRCRRFQELKIEERGKAAGIFQANSVQGSKNSVEEMKEEEVIAGNRCWDLIWGNQYEKEVR